MSETYIAYLSVKWMWRTFYNSATRLLLKLSNLIIYLKEQESRKLTQQKRET